MFTKAAIIWSKNTEKNCNNIVKFSIFIYFKADFLAAFTPLTWFFRNNYNMLFFVQEILLLLSMLNTVVLFNIFVDSLMNGK